MFSNKNFSYLMLLLTYKLRKGLNELMSLIKREKQVILDEVNRLSALANSYKAAYEEIVKKIFF